MRCYEGAKTNNAGMHVIAFVMDNGPNNVSAVKSMKITDDTISVAGKKTFLFVDTPHLVKNTRGNLSKNGFVDDEGVKVNWGYIQTLESINSSHFPRYCPRLTHHHVNLQPFKEMNVSKAAQVLSQSVSVGLNMLVDQGKLPVAARNTARFCKIFDNLFDTFNSSSMYSPKALKCALSNDSKHWKFLDEAEDYILKLDRKSTRLNSSHLVISYAVFCLKKKKKKPTTSSANTRRCRVYRRTTEDQYKQQVVRVLYLAGL